MRTLVALLASLVLATAETQATFTAASASSPGAAVTTLTLLPAVQSEPTSGPDGAVGLAWAASPSAGAADVTYYVLRRPAGSGSFAAVAGPLATLDHSDDPESDGSYEYLIRAVASSFTADSAARAAVSDRTPPSRVTLTSTSGTLGGDATVELSWTAATDATSGVAAYAVYHAQVLTPLSPCPAAGAPDYAHTILADALTTSTSVLTDLALTYHCFYVVAYDVAGNESAASDVSGPTASQ